MIKHSGLPNIPNVKNIIAVASGKGGVGKSTVSVNLALALLAEGARVGILDADIYGPSQPLMLGIHEHPQTEDQKLLPIIRHGLQSMSIGYLVDESTPMVWRGPMVTRALQQLLMDTKWDALDYLVIDLPPGTGDIQLTLAQKIPITGAVIVTTPQDLALLDARRAIEMFQKVHVPILGIVENMSMHTCSSCGHDEAIFGEGGGERIAEEYKTELLARLPLLKAIRSHTDAGTPTVVADPQSPVTTLYRGIASRLITVLKAQYRAFPKIVVE